MKIKDIAQALHLSTSTVSKALNGAFDVSKETKQIVLDYAKAHGYKLRDERLTVKSIRRLCVLYDNISQSSPNIIMPLTLSFSNFARENNFEVIHNPLSSITTSYEKFMKENNYDGAFIAGLNYNSPYLEEIKNTTIPTVVYDSDLLGDKVATISNENINTISEIVNKLVSLGHKKIGFIHGDKSSFISNERFAGYIIGLTKNNLEYNPKYVFDGNFSEQSGLEASEFFTQTDVTAVICSADIIAIGLIKGFEKFGIKVPNDISVTGYDDLDIAKYVSPALTTVKQDLDLISEKAYSLLQSMIMNRSSQRVIIKGEVIYRKSISRNKNE